MQSVAARLVLGEPGVCGTDVEDGKEGGGKAEEPCVPLRRGEACPWGVAGGADAGGGAEGGGSDCGRAEGIAGERFAEGGAGEVYLGRDDGIAGMAGRAVVDEKRGECEPANQTDEGEEAGGFAFKTIEEICEPVKI